MAIQIVCSLVLLFVFGITSTNASEDYCSSDTFDNLAPHMQFTKEATTAEYGIIGEFKELHCCAKGYRSIEWYKDGQAYPWGLDLSTLLILPESANQTIHTQMINEGDTGNYTCLLRNATVVQTHTINLKVFAGVPDEAQITYVSPDKEVFLGQSTRLFCEAFGGRIELPDAHSEVRWLKILENGTTIDVPDDLEEKKISRDNNDTFGSYLIFPEIKPDHFATYKCIITKPGYSISKTVSVREKEEVLDYRDPNPFPTKELILISIGLVIMFTALCCLVRQYGLKVQVLLKDQFGALESDDGKTSDVLIAYSPKDSEIALGVLKSNLESRGYKCQAQELSQDISNWLSELSPQIHQSRRILTLISPAALKDSWASSNLYQALKQLQNVNDNTKLICVSLKELPTSQNEPKNSVGETLASVARSMHVIVWERAYDAKFWLTLCKELPARRGTPSTLIRAPLENGGARPRLATERSIDSLMV